MENLEFTKKIAEGSNLNTKNDLEKKEFHVDTTDGSADMKAVDRTLNIFEETIKKHLTLTKTAEDVEEESVEEPTLLNTVYDTMNKEYIDHLVSIPEFYQFIKDLIFGRVPLVNCTFEDPYIYLTSAGITLDTMDIGDDTRKGVTQFVQDQICDTPHNSNANDSCNIYDSVRPLIAIMEKGTLGYHIFTASSENVCLSENFYNDKPRDKSFRKYVRSCMHAIGDIHCIGSNDVVYPITEEEISAKVREFFEDFYHAVCDVYFYEIPIDFHERDNFMRNEIDGMVDVIRAFNDYASVQCFLIKRGPKAYWEFIKNIDKMIHD